MAKAKAKKKTSTKKAAAKAPVRKRAPKEVIAPPDPPDVEETPEEAAVIEDLEPEPEPVATVLCRYCGKEIPKPIGSTFFKCDTCEGTGDPLNADQV